MVGSDAAAMKFSAHHWRHTVLLYSSTIQTRTLAAKPSTALQESSLTAWYWTVPRSHRPYWLHPNETEALYLDTHSQQWLFCSSVHTRSASEHLLHRTNALIMAALCNRAGHYVFALWFLSSFFPCLISAVADWISTILPHMVWP